MYITNAGNVGIGTSSPAAKLHISGTNAGIIFDRITTDVDPSGAQGSIWVKENGISNYEAMMFRATGYRWQSDDGTDRMLINSSGNVGIGVSSISAIGSGRIVEIGSPSGNTSFTMFSINGSRTGFVYSNASETCIGSLQSTPLLFKTVDTERARFDSDGSFTLKYASNVLMRQARPIDLSALNTSYYYPVRLSIGPDATYRFRIENALNTNVPSWATHGGGFTIFLDWEVNGSGWGSAPVGRTINKYFEAFTTVTICGGITQMGNSSYEVVWLRGGGTYNFYCDRYVNVNVETSSFTQYGQTVAPQTSVVNSPWDTPDQQVGFGYLNVRLNAAVGGSLSKGSGSFRIEHPLPSKSETHQLVHSFIEGPQADLIYRGKVTLVNGAASVNIDTASTMTEGTFEALCREVQCFTTNESGWTAVRGKVAGNILTIEAQDSICTDEISWMVIGERKDKHMLDTEWTDDDGKVIVEPLKTTNAPTNTVIDV
jgi:hypothetical protein